MEHLCSFRLSHGSRQTAGLDFHLIPRTRYIILFPNIPYDFIVLRALCTLCRFAHQVHQPCFVPLIFSSVQRITPGIPFFAVCSYFFFIRTSSSLSRSDMLFIFSAGTNWSKMELAVDLEATYSESVRCSSDVFDDVLEIDFEGSRVACERSGTGVLPKEMRRGMLMGRGWRQEGFGSDEVGFGEDMEMLRSVSRSLEKL